MTDPIADMLTRIRNASAVKKSEVVLPMSNMKHGIAQILAREGWLESAEIIKGNNQKNQSAAFDQLKLVIKYQKGKPVINAINRISTSGRRVYVGREELPRVLNNLGIAIISTSQGLMTNKEAKKKGVGGEIICEIY